MLYQARPSNLTAKQSHTLQEYMEHIPSAGIDQVVLYMPCIHVHVLWCGVGIFTQGKDKQYWIGDQQSN